MGRGDNWLHSSRESTLAKTQYISVAAGRKRRQYDLPHRRAPSGKSKTNMKYSALDVSIQQFPTRVMFLLVYCLAGSALLLSKSPKNNVHYLVQPVWVPSIISYGTM